VSLSPAASAGAANVAAVREQIDAIARGDYRAALAGAHPDLQLEIFAPPEFPWIRQARGIEAMMAAMTHNFASLDQQTPTIDNVIAQEDTVVLFGQEQGIIRATGAAYHVQFVHRFTFADGRLVHVRIVAARRDPDGPR
jgi:ketosteroid isomerase-like protein